MDFIVKNKYVLYGSPGSYFSGKARAFLRNKGIPHDDVMASVAAYVKVIFPKTRMHYIPVVTTPAGEVLQDTSDIIDALDRVFPDPTIWPSSPKQRLTAAIFEVFSDEWMFLPAMHYRWNFDETNADFNRLEFGVHLFPGLPAYIRDGLATAVMAPWRQVIYGIGITPTTIPEIEKRSLWLFDQLNQNFSKHSYVLGNRPSLADISLMGPFTHLCRDPYPKAIIERDFPTLMAWYQRMFDPDIESFGAYLPADRIPENITEILNFVFEEPFATTLDASLKFQTWRAHNPKLPIPRVIGRHQRKIGNISPRVICQPYSQWMLQRARQIFDSTAGGEHLKVERWLDKLNGLHYFTTPLPIELYKDGYKLRSKHRVNSRNDVRIA